MYIKWADSRGFGPERPLQGVGYRSNIAVALDFTGDPAVFT